MPSRPTPVRALAALVLALVLAPAAAVPAAPPETLAEAAVASAAPIVEVPVDPALPAPRVVIGIDPGDRAIRHAEALAALEALAAASDHVRLVEYGRTHEGRALVYAIVTGAENQRRLEQIRATNARLADPRRLETAEEGARLARSHPAIAWMAACIHGDELSGTDAFVHLAHRLAAGTDEATRRMREQLVVIIDPLQNPDGRERYLDQLRTLSGKVPTTDARAMQHSGLWSAGRGNHYLFDLNRDWVPQAQPETRARLAAIGAWSPHLLVDAHEMGGLDTYLFDPPREPINPALSPRVRAWRERFARDQAAAFDAEGWSYYTRDWYEEWYPGYTNAWASLRGAIGLLYEQAGVNGGALRKPSGRIETYRDAVRRQYTSAVANLSSLLENRLEVVSSFAADRRRAIEGGEGEPTGTLLLPPSADRSRLVALASGLRRQGIEVEEAVGDFVARGLRGSMGEALDERRLPAGTIVVRSRQPLRRLLHAIASFDPRMTDAFLVRERTELERRGDTLLYDGTAWSLPLAAGLEAWWADDTPGLATRPWTAPAPGTEVAATADARFGWIVDGADADVQRMIVRLQASGVAVRAATKPFVVGGRLHPIGSLLVRANENEARVVDVLRTVASDLRVAVVDADTAFTANGWDLGGPSFELLEAPRVAVATDWPVSSLSFGATWHLLDARLGFATSPVNVQRLGSMDLRGYTVLVLPSMGGAGRVLDDGALENVRAWVRAGGTLVTLGATSSFLAAGDSGLTDARRRRDVLDELDAYEEWAGRELAARSVAVDPAEVWGGPVDESVDEPVDEPDAAPAPGADRPSGEALARLDRWQRRFAPTGVFARGRLDPEHWLCAGLPEAMPLYAAGSTILLAGEGADVPARYAMDPNDLRLSGLLWPEARARLAGGAAIVRTRVGDGQVILFAGDPSFRGLLLAEQRLLGNAILLGPGLGTSRPAPW